VRRLLISTAVLMAGLSLVMPAQAATIVLDFEGVGDGASVDDFYNGGTDSFGNSGLDYGISFSRTSLGIVDIDAGGNGNFGNEPSPDTVLFFLNGGAATMNVDAGFDAGFSFFYAADAFNAGSVVVYDGLNATGNILANLSLTPNGGNCAGDPNGLPFCQFDPFGVSFAGIARSVDFAGVANQIAFDNITLGSAIPDPGPISPSVPEPATWAMLLMGFGVVGGVLRRRREQSSLLAAPLA